MLERFGPPLREVASYDPSLQVEPRLNQTHLKSFHTENDIKMEIFSLCCQLELLCKKNYCKSKEMNDTCKMEFSNKFTPHACVELKKINERFTLISNKNTSFKDYMLKNGMKEIFPKMWWYINQHTDEPLPQSTKPSLNDYFNRLASLNELNVMSQQLYSDVHNLVDHKYMAHQTALLYHAITDLGGYVKRYKKSIEDCFGVVKKALTVEDDQIPHLPSNEKQRLENMTTLLMDLCTGYDTDLVDPMMPIVSFFLR